MEKLILKDKKGSVEGGSVASKNGGTGEFYIDDYIESLAGKTNKMDRGYPFSEDDTFKSLCKAVQAYFDKQWKEGGEMNKKFLKGRQKQ